MSLHSSSKLGAPGPSRTSLELPVEQESQTHPGALGVGLRGPAISEPPRLPSGFRGLDARPPAPPS